MKIMNPDSVYLLVEGIIQQAAKDYMKGYNMYRKSGIKGKTMLDAEKFFYSDYLLKLTGIDEINVTDILRNLEERAIIEDKKRKPKFTVKTIDEDRILRDLKETNLSRREIADKNNTSYNSVFKINKKYKIRLGSAEKSKRDRELAIKMYTRGLTQKEISEKIGVSKTTVGKYLYGIERGENNEI